MPSKRQRNKAKPRTTRRPTRPAWRVLLDGKGPIFWFCVKFIFFTASFHLLFHLPTLKGIENHLAAWDARIASVFVNIFGEGSNVAQGTILNSPRYAITILPACTSLESVFFFGAALLAFPAPFSRKLIGILVGAVAILALNQVRVIVLFLVGVHLTSFFDTLHEEAWGLISIPITIYLCLVWIKWAKHHVSSQIPTVT
jgi:exosortase/archaeosortase family protein